MFNFTKKTLRSLFLLVAFLLFAVIFLSHIKVPVSDVAKGPLGFMAFMRREFSGIIFYHRNYLENERLNKETDFLRQKLNAGEEARIENQRLKKLLSLKLQSAYKVVAARVIGRCADSWSSVVVIDKGSLHGIKRGMPVITYLGLAGRIMETNYQTSSVMLINDPGLCVSSIVQRSRQEGLVCGTLGENLIMRYLSEDADIAEGDVIVTSGLNAHYPKGILIGKVVDVGKEFSGLNRYALIKPEVRLGNIEEILVIVQ